MNRRAGRRRLGDKAPVDFIQSRVGAGSEGIPSAVLQVISNVVDRRMSLEQAMKAPRVFSYA